MLAAGVRPDGAGASRRAGGEPADRAAFADLLVRARDGGVASGRRVSLPREAQPPTESQAVRLSIAADRAEAAGAARALVMLDGRNLLLDVAARTAHDIVSTSDGVPAVLSGIDVAVVVPADPDEPHDPSSNTTSTDAGGAGDVRPPRTIDNRSVAELLIGPGPDEEAPPAT